VQVLQTKFRKFPSLLKMIAISALTLLVGRQEERLARKK